MAPRVFVSYTHDSPRHKDEVLGFAEFLRGQGVEAVLDSWHTGVRQDWYAWAIREMTDADHVIVVASPKYREMGDGSGPNEQHKGVQSEAALLRDLLHGDRATWTAKVLPVVLPGHRTDEIPRFLSPATTSFFEVTAYTTDGAELLLRVLHRKPEHIAPAVGAAPDLPPRSGPAAAGPDARDPAEDGGSVQNVITGNVSGRVVQARDIQGGVHF